MEIVGHNMINAAFAAMTGTSTDTSRKYAADIVDLLVLIVGVKGAMKMLAQEDEGVRVARRRKAKENEADIRWLTGALQGFENLATALKSGDGKHIGIVCDEAISRYRQTADHPDGDDWTIDAGVRLLKRIKENALHDNTSGRHS